MSTTFNLPKKLVPVKWKVFTFTYKTNVFFPDFIVQNLFLVLKKYFKTKISGVDAANKDQFEFDKN